MTEEHRPQEGNGTPQWVYKVPLWLYFYHKNSTGLFYSTYLGSPSAKLPKNSSILQCKSPSDWDWADYYHFWSLEKSSSRSRMFIAQQSLINKLVSSQPSINGST